MTFAGLLRLHRSASVGVPFLVWLAPDGSVWAAPYGTAPPVGGVLSAEWVCLDDEAPVRERPPAGPDVHAFVPGAVAKDACQGPDPWRYGDRCYLPEAHPVHRPQSIDAAHLARQRAFSERTFGPGLRTEGIIDHIRKELREISADPTDVEEWVDVVILAFDGAWRAGHEPQAIIDAIAAKQARNEARTWPDWRTTDPGRAIEHVRDAGGAR